MPTRIPEPPEGDDLSKIIDEHAADVGSVAIAWNELHSALGELFAEVVDRTGRSMALAIWEAVSSDRSKRAMLLAACSVGLDDCRFTKEVVWTAGQADDLENRRNNAIHAPYSLTIDDGALKMIPYVFGGNQRARNLHGRDLGVELESYWINIQHLSQFVRDLRGRSRLPADGLSWPEKPRLPRPAHSQARKS